MVGGGREEEEERRRERSRRNDVAHGCPGSGREGGSAICGGTGRDAGPHPSRVGRRM